MKAWSVSGTSFAVCLLSASALIGVGNAQESDPQDERGVSSDVLNELDALAADLGQTDQETLPETRDNILTRPQARTQLPTEDENPGDPDIEVDANTRIAPLFAPGGAGLATTEDEAEADAPEYQQMQAVMLRGLDKITGEATDFEANVDDPVIFGGLRVTVRACWMAPPTEPPESKTYLEIEDFGFSVEDPESLPEEIDKERRVFFGWMFASSPGLNALEHPIYDVWVTRCTVAAPDLSETESPS